MWDRSTTKKRQKNALANCATETCLMMEGKSCATYFNKSPWRNWLARLTVNQEVGSSSLPGDVFFFVFLQFSYPQILVGFD
ncbi:hypothetical protein N7466_002794 [Penicillium verhagenii]|uniref:uncharacterized protein n=1 Tax=Penicillium verhagenii TaxID=1562060 RepID=UPI002545A6DD|nr:uncharacterized protein N7466_002794 [Penicillium verhagenii]KAJ5939660.1 hypothetical protein N7466_002794 [Penicillium verhagenii]